MIPHTLDTLLLTYIEAVEEVVSLLLVLLKKLKVLEHFFLNRHFIIVADGIFTQEVKHHNIFLAVLLFVEGDVLHTQGAAAHGVCLVLILLITCPESQLGKQTLH